jgi:hypothetical protein
LKRPEKACADAWIEKNETITASSSWRRVSAFDRRTNLTHFAVPADGLVFDEAAFCQENAWQQVLRPMLSDRGGWAMFITTPNGCNWFFDLFQQANRLGWDAGKPAARIRL